MRKNIRKYVLSCICGLMIFGAVFAAPGSMGKVLAEEEDVFRVAFLVDTDHVFDFIMDPQELISRTNAAAYGGLTFEEGATLFFRRHDRGAEVDYSSSSDALVITNMGTEDVEITVSASISSDSMEKITMTDDSTFTEDTKASLYLALTDGVNTVPILEGEDAVLRIAMTGAEEGAQEEYRFWLVGAVNKNGDWSEVREEVPKVTVTWSAAAKETEEPEAEEPEEDTSAGKEPEKEEISSKETEEQTGTLQEEEAEEAEAPETEESPKSETKEPESERPETTEGTETPAEPKLPEETGGSEK